MKRKFSDSEIIESIIKEYQEGVSARKLSNKYKCDRTVIVGIMNRANIPMRNIYERTRKLKVNESYFDVIDTEEKAYWLGFLFADGCIKNNRNSYSVSLGVDEKDKEVIYKFKQSLSSEHKVRIEKRPYNDKILTMYCISLTSHKLAQALIELGCKPRKSLTTELPVKISDYFMRHFIRGYFDGDGCVGFKDTKYYYPSVSICVSKKFGEQLKQFLAKEYNIKCSFYPTRTIYCLSMQCQQAIKFLNIIYKESSIFLQRKYDKTQDVLLKEKKRVQKRLVSWHGRKILQYDKNLNLVAEYRSAVDAKKKTGISNSNIISCCNDKRKNAGNYIWRFQNEL